MRSVDVDPANPALSGGALTELVARPERGRVFTQRMRPGLADCAPSGRIRLDGLARWLQEIAYADVEDAGLAFHAVWVVRRTRLRIDRFPRFTEHFRLETFCSGLGRMWAERRTTIHRDGAEQPDVEAVSLWVHLDPVSWRPSPFAQQELAIYSDALPERRITSRLHHPAPDSAPELARFHFRASECDVAGHVNNAVYWQALEEELLAGRREPERFDVELEYRNPAQPGEKQILARGPHRWIVDPGGAVHASIAIATCA